MSIFGAIGDFVSGAFETVTNWVTGSAGNVVQAVASDAMKGAIYGSVIGAAQSALTGGNIKKGALRGAAYGGIATGVTSSLMRWSGMDDAVQAGSDSSNRVSESMGALPRDELTAKATGYTAPTETPGLLDVTGKYVKDAADTGKRWWEKLDDEEQGKIIGGVLQGSATAAGNYFTAKQQAEADKELLEYKTRIDKDKIAANQPSRNFSQKSARIDIKNRWDRWVQ